MDFPSNIHNHCPNCDDETLHKVLKGKVGKNKQLTLDCTIQCTLCNFIHHTTITEKKMISVPIIISDQDKSVRKLIELHPDEELRVDHELIMDEDNLQITSLEVKDTRVRHITAKDVSTIWAKFLDPEGKVKLSISVHKGPKTMSHTITALYDEEFFIGDILRIGRGNVAIYKIKTNTKVVKYDSAIAGDIVRIYGRVIR
jgi:uncharacterized Zn finger protein